MRLSQKSLTVAAASLLAVSSVGCTALSQKKSDPLSKKKTAKSDSSLLDRLPWIGKDKEEEVEPYPDPVKIAATWTPDTLVQSGRTPTRGFGGRVFFYDEKSRPVPVEGTLIVHGFNDAAAEPSERVKRFEFTPEQFTRHFSQTDLGASYSIWVPWDAVGGEQSRISLVTSFKTADGKMVQGVPATLMLPGQAPEESAEQLMAAKLSPQYQKHVEAAESGTTRSSGLTTTTIPRKRTIVPGKTDVPGITIPAVREKQTMIAAGQKTTPSFDLDMPSRQGRSAVQPASVNMPLK